MQTPMVKCAECGAPFPYKPKQKFCSRRCRVLANNRIWREKNGLNSKEKFCEFCRAPFWPKGPQRFCSAQCLEYHNDGLTVEDVHNDGPSAALRKINDDFLRLLHFEALIAIREGLRP